MPTHMDMPAPGAPVSTCGPNVSHRNAPGAISAMALLVSPVRPSVGLVPDPVVPAVGGWAAIATLSFRPASGAAMSARRTTARAPAGRSGTGVALAVVSQVRAG